MARIRKSQEPLTIIRRARLKQVRDEMTLLTDQTTRGEDPLHHLTEVILGNRSTRENPDQLNSLPILKFRDQPNALQHLPRQLSPLEQELQELPPKLDRNEFVRVARVNTLCGCVKSLSAWSPLTSTNSYALTVCATIVSAKGMGSLSAPTNLNSSAEKTVVEHDTTDSSTSHGQKRLSAPLRSTWSTTRRNRSSRSKIGKLPTSAESPLLPTETTVQKS